MDVKIEEAREAVVKGVKFRFFAKEMPYENENFSWLPQKDDISINSEEIIIGRLTASKAAVVFEKLEYHDDAEVFCYYKGSPIICFCEINENKPLMDSARLVRLNESAVVRIAAGIGHFVPVTTDLDDVEAFVISSSKIKTYNIDLEEKIHGIL